MHGRQGCLVAYVRTEHSIEKGFLTHETQPNVNSDYRTHRTHRWQSPDYEGQDATPWYPTQDGFLLMLSLFYVWFQNTRLCLFLIVFQKCHLILPLFDLVFQGIV